MATIGEADGGAFTHLLARVTSRSGETTRYERGPDGRLHRVLYIRVAVSM